MGIQGGCTFMGPAELHPNASDSTLIKDWNTLICLYHGTFQLSEMNCILCLVFHNTWCGFPCQLWDLPRPVLLSLSVSTLLRRDWIVQWFSVEPDLKLALQLHHFTPIHLFYCASLLDNLFEGNHYLNVKPGHGIYIRYIQRKHALAQLILTCFLTFMVPRS